MVLYSIQSRPGDAQDKIYRLFFRTGRFCLGFSPFSFNVELIKRVLAEYKMARFYGVIFPVFHFENVFVFSSYFKQPEGAFW